MDNVQNCDSYMGLLTINKFEITWKETIKV
jgi:hypothetical protein